jgi:hypothetical protein
VGPQKTALLFWGIAQKLASTPLWVADADSPMLELLLNVVIVAIVAAPLGLWSG